MDLPLSNAIPTPEQAARWAPEQVVELVQEKVALQERIARLEQQLEWFRRQIFGQKSERRLIPVPAGQLHLGEVPLPETAPEQPTKPVAAHNRRVRHSGFAAGGDESALFFDESRVPVQTIELACPQAQGLTSDQYEIIGQKVTHRLAQRPGSYVVLKYVRPVVKVRATQALHCAPAPVGVIEGSRADVSFIAGMLIDKLAWHLPLHRQHQRLAAAGFRVSRGWLTQLATQAGDLLMPIYEAQLASIRASRVKAMDETPIKAGRVAPGKMGAAYFWPVYGERDEICFAFCPDRTHANVEHILGATPTPEGVLLSDGYGAYAEYTKKVGLTHAQCWTHCRREFVKAEAAAPEQVAQALEYIGALYAVEAQIRESRLRGQSKREYRLDHARPVVDTFFGWVQKSLQAQALLPTSPLTKALGYAHRRRAALEVFLADPEVPLDTNHVERAIRPVAIGRKNWMFSWTELGARHMGAIQSLIATCRLHEIDPYTYLVDVLQRVGEHPASQVELLTPRLWKQHFADDPLRSDISLHGATQ